MSDAILFARQPIFDARQNVFGYELLFRNGNDNCAQFIDGDLATRSVLLNAYADNDAPSLLNGKPGLINASCKMLPSFPTFASRFLIVELLESEHKLPGVVEHLKTAQQRGFTIALDDFNMSSYSPELIEQVDIVRLDTLQYGRSELANAVDVLSQHSVRLLAEKVETYEDFQFCKSLGFDYYQGYFFCRPELVRGSVVDANRQAIYQLLNEIYQPEVDMTSLVNIVKRDAVLSYKLLKLVNSSFYRRTQEVESISHAVMLLGVSKIRQWVTLVTLGNLKDKPSELSTESLLRAHMCEFLGKFVDEATASMAFSIGLLSCLPAWLDRSMVELIHPLSLKQDIRDALIQQKGFCGQLLELVVYFLHSDWHEVTDARLETLGFTHSQFSEAYEYAIQQADNIAAMVASDD